MRLRKLDSFQPALDGGSGGDRLRETNKDGAGPWCASDCLQPLVRHSKGLPWGDFNGGSYLRISCREEVISLPTHRSTARGQSHLQCRSREAGGGKEGEVQGSRGGWEGGGGRESRALITPTGSAPHSNDKSQHRIQRLHDEY